MSLTVRQWVWSGLAALAMVALVLKVRSPEGTALVEAETRRAPPQSATGQAASPWKRESLPLPETDPFAPRVAAPPPPAPAPVVTVEPVREVAPPLPFRFMARVTGVDGRETVFVTRENRVIAVQAGEVIDQHYRVERVDAEVVVFTYLPLQEQQSMSAR